MKVAVHPACRRRGVGSLLVEYLRSADPAPCVTVRTRERNLEAQLFFRALGFRATKIIRGFFRDTHEDAIDMICV